MYFIEIRNGLVWKRHVDQILRSNEQNYEVEMII